MNHHLTTFCYFVCSITMSISCKYKKIYLVWMGCVFSLLSPISHSVSPLFFTTSGYLWWPLFRIWWWRRAQQTTWEEKENQESNVSSLNCCGYNVRITWHPRNTSRTYCPHTSLVLTLYLMLVYRQVPFG